MPTLCGAHARHRPRRPRRLPAPVSCRGTHMWPLRYEQHGPLPQASPGVKQKHEVASEVNGARRKSSGSGDGHHRSGQLLDAARAPKVSSRSAKAIKILIFSTPARWYLYDTLLQVLPQTSKTWWRNSGSYPESARHGGSAIPRLALAWGPRRSAPHPRSHPMRCATRPGCHPRRAVAGEPGDAVDARGLTGLGKGHRRQDGGEPPHQHRSRCKPQASRVGAGYKLNACVSLRFIIWSSTVIA